MAQPMSATAKPVTPSETPLTPLSGMPKRNARQLVLLLLGGLIIFALQLAVDMGFHDTTSATTFALPIVITAVALAAWGITVAFAPYADPLFVGIAAMLTGIGIVFIRRLNYTFGANAIDVDDGMFAGVGGRQLMYFIAGVVLFGAFLALVRNHRMLRGYAYILLFAGIAFAALPGFLPASISEVDGSKNWIRLGPISVQPSEFAKLMLLVFFAVYLVRKRDVLSVAGPKVLGLQFPRLKDLGPIVIVWAASLGMLILEKDLGTSLLLFSIFLSMLYIATRRVSWILIGLGLFVGGCVALYPFFSHLQVRVAIWLNPFTDEYYYGQWPSSFQLVQGLIGMNKGGLLGNGPGMGRPDIVPAGISDFILATLGEEIGLFGVMAILVLYALFIERGFKTALMSRDLFGKLLAGGLAFSVAFQLFVVVGGITQLIPLTGQTTPFLSAGGSSLVGGWLLVAMLVRVSDDARKPWQVSYGLQKTEAPPEFLAEQAAKRAAEEAAKAEAAGVGVEGPVPGGDQPTELIIPAELQGGQSSPVSAPPQSPPQRTDRQPGPPNHQSSPPPSPPNPAFDHRPQPPGPRDTEKKEGDL
ncbi:FtsW/RodA/SpoVE family cell cycle protein [Glycomyces sp. L485]|uniref:FtsW/RodA/SpoVE family cell cycle protein n=1 Tax=Glycomyces sp. L485 TaxID=2909235 RepID=UPI001F4B901D|nr:FtsW/RodA/SpoVE family cell cycle protein [Glycomyces sp. L485]MCH7229492.1 FtsW/RodA/SpoVE family cell cycle protein [Glycomyces sp. L485]